MSEKTKSNFIKTLAKTAFPSWSGRKFYFEISDRPETLNSYWDGGSKDTYVLVDIKTKRVSIPGTNGPYQKEYPKFQPLPGLALVRHTIFCGKDVGCTVHLHPEDKEKVT